MPSDMIDIAQDISTLYELSLNIGNSFDVQEAASAFLFTLAERKRYDFVTLWMYDKKFDQYVLTYSTPFTQIKDTLISPDHRIPKQLATAPIFSISSQDEGFVQMINERIEVQGAFAFFSLPTIGFVKIFDKSRRRAFSQKELNQLEPLMSKFGDSLAQCLAHQELTAEIAERKRVETELLQSKETVEQSAKAKERFLANMSHEMRTPLNAIIGMTHLISGTTLTKQQIGYLEAIQFSSDALLALINDILDFAKIGEGKIEFERVSFKLEELLGGLFAMMRFPAERKKLKLRFEIDPTIPRLLVGDPMRLHQVLLNLVGNAIKFTEEGFVWLKVYPVDHHTGDWVLAFEVSDTGIGIAEDKLHHIFDSFTQASSDTTRRFGGSGLGLAIVKELVEQQQGNITAKSLVNHGSVFTVTLNFYEASDASEMPTMEKEVQTQIDLQGVKILVVEDNEMNRFVAEQTLNQWGIVVDVAANGRIAVDKVQKNRYDLILMDVQMPEMDGYTATRIIRDSMYSMQELPIIALTASMLKNYEQAIFEAGMNDYVLKPFNPNSLKQSISKHIALLRQHEVIAEPITVEHIIAPVASPPLAEVTVSANGKLRNGYTHPNRQVAMPPKPRKPLVDLSELVENAFGNQEFIYSVLQLFLQQTPEQMQELVAGWKHKDWDYVKFMAHKMKASARMLGITKLGDLLQSVEEDIWNNGKLPDKDKRLHDIMMMVQESTEFVEQELHAHS